MDPNANLQEQERIINRAQRQEASAHIVHDRYEFTPEDRERLYELREALTGWLSRGGFAPDWNLGPVARGFYGR